MAIRSNLYRMVDRVLDGQTERILRDLFSEEGGWEQVSRRLFAEHQVTVSGQTLRRWGPELGIGDDHDRVAS